MGGMQRGRFLRVLLVLAFLSMQQICVTDATIDLLINGITTVEKTFRVVCTVTGEQFVGWFDVNGNEVTARQIPDELMFDKYYVEENGNSYTLVIQNVVVADGGDYTCRGERTEKTFTLYVEFFVTQFPLDQSLTVGNTQIILCSAEGFPKPTFEWYKNFKRVKFDQEPRLSLLSNGSMLIDSVVETDTGQYICRITQLGEEQGTSLREQQKVIKVTAYGPPRINTEESTKRTELYSYVGSKSAAIIKCVWWGYPNPTLSIRKNDNPLASTDVTVKAPTETDLLSYLTATVMMDGEDDFGTYVCHASNSLGSATHFVDINKQGPPSAPKNITFTATCDHLTVAWLAPDSDGGLPLARYSIVINDTNEWSDTVFVGPTTNRFTFTSKEGVKPRTLYTVAVVAFNELKTGEKGQGSVTSAYCSPSGPYIITNTDTWLNSTSFMLKWTRPPHDGGDPDLHYSVEYSKETLDGKYMHWNSRKNINAQEYNVTGLESGAKYEFRVFASNIAGRKREPASMEFNVYSGLDKIVPTPTAPDQLLPPPLVYDISVNCTSFYMQVDFTLKSSYLDTDTFRFDNTSCGSHTATSEHVSLRTPLDACGTTSRDNGDTVTYENKVVAKTKDENTIYIVEFPFSCTYRTHETIGVASFQSRKKVTYFEEGYGNFSFEMGLYRSSDYTSPYDVSEYPVGVDPFGQLYGEAKLETSDSGLVLLADMCVATPSMNPADSVQYTFIDDGCPVDNGTKYDHTMTRTQRFQLVPFRWIPENFTLVYLHCNVIVCSKDGNSRCSMGCQPDRRRARSTGNKETHRVTLGPIRHWEPHRSASDILNREPLPHSDTPRSSRSSIMPTWLLILCICGAVIGLGFMLYGTVHLVLFLASTPHNAAVPPVQTNSEELELFCSEIV